MGGGASFSDFSVGRVGGRPVFVVKNRVGVGGRPGTPGPVGGPADHSRGGSSCYFVASEGRVDVHIGVIWGLFWCRSSKSLLNGSLLCNFSPFFVNSWLVSLLTSRVLDVQIFGAV